MDLFVLSMQRKERHDGEFGPEALVCWDETELRFFLADMADMADNDVS